MPAKKNQTARKRASSRRGVIKKLAYSAPVVITSFFFSKAHAVPPSACNPNDPQCGPPPVCPPNP